MRTFHIILCIVDLIVFVGFLTAPDVWINIFFLLFIFTAIMLIALGILLLSNDEDDFYYPEDHPLLQEFRKRYEDDLN